MYTKHPTHPGGDEDGGEKEQGEHESDGEPAQPGDESDQAGIHIKFYHQAMSSMCSLDMSVAIII